MHQLIDYIDADDPLPLQAIRDGFEYSSQGFVLRKLMGQCVVRQLKYTKDMTDANLDVFDGAPGYTSALMAACSIWNRTGRKMFYATDRKNFILCDDAGI